MRRSPHLRLPERRQHEAFVGSSIQMQTPMLERETIPRFVTSCADRGVDLKWFGDEEPKAFTSCYDSWWYLGDVLELPQTLAVLARTLDMRIPLTFTRDDCAEIAEIVVDVLKGF